mmetsp:Transcript_9678/g.13437  ORF Transcript_9678/g.13437 Transcript_9678/m.13437 type:complete len:185 (+) Transcript_9678:74-628(+)
MMNSSDPSQQMDLPALTKGLSLCVGILVLICCIVFMSSSGTYISVVVGFETMLFTIIQLVIETQAPESVIENIRSSLPVLLSAPSQIFLSILICLFLFAMYGFGIAMAIIVLATVALNIYIANTYPDAMPQRYAYPDSATSDLEGHDSTPYATKVGGATLEPPVGQYSGYAQPPQQHAPSTADL